MAMTDEELLGRLESLLPIRARLVTHRGGGKGRFELVDQRGNEFDIPDISPLRIIAVLRKHGYPEAFEEIVVFDGEIVFSKPPGLTAGSKKTSHPMDSNRYVQSFF